MAQRPKKLLHFSGLSLMQREFEQDIGVDEIHWSPHHSSILWWSSIELYSS
jgi:hypothetical protein